MVKRYEKFLAAVGFSAADIDEIFRDYLNSLTEGLSMVYRSYDVCLEIAKNNCRDRGQFFLFRAVSNRNFFQYKSFFMPEREQVKTKYHDIVVEEWRRRPLIRFFPWLKVWRRFNPWETVANGQQN